MTLWRQLRRLFRPKQYAKRRHSNRHRFRAVFRDRHWVVGESVSGPGSDRGSGSVDHTTALLRSICADHDVRSIADIPCGDFNWMGAFLAEHPQIAYVGYDIVPELIQQNRLDHPAYRFEVLDITRRTPPAYDLIICKDLVNHLLERDVWATLRHLSKSGSKLILITSNSNAENEELDLHGPGASRLLNLSAAPYSLPEPLYADHYLSLWPGAALAQRLAERDR